MQSLSASAQWNLQKIFMFLCIYISSLFHLSSQNCSPSFTSRLLYSDLSGSFRTSYFQKLLLRSIRWFQDILLPETVIQSVRQFSGHFQKLLSQSVRWFSGHFTSRNCCPSPSGDFQDILLPEILIRSIKWVQGILLLIYHYYIYVILLYDYLNYFVFRSGFPIIFALYHFFCY